MISRTDVRTVACPTCVVPAGCPCLTGRSRARTSCHAERWQAYRATLPTLLPLHLRPTVYKHRHGWACTTSRDYRRCRTSYVSDTPVNAYMRWFRMRNLKAQREIVDRLPTVLTHLTERERRYLTALKGVAR